MAQLISDQPMFAQSSVLTETWGENYDNSLLETHCVIADCSICYPGHGCVDRSHDVWHSAVHLLLASCLHVFAALLSCNISDACFSELDAALDC